MTIWGAVLSFALVAGLLTMIPGLDTVLVLRSAIAHGRRPAFATALGIMTGCLAWGVAAAAGISALLTASTIGYTALRVVGAGYLLWLGGRMVASAVRPTRRPSAESAAVEAQLPVAPGAGDPAGDLWRSWRRGVVTNLLNPKVGAFYVAMLPQFMPEHVGPLAMGLLLALVHDLEGMLWFTVIILGFGRIRPLLNRATGRRVVDVIAGTALIGFGLRLGLL